VTYPLIDSKLVNDLTKVLRDTESSLANQPSEYSTQLEFFVGEDERVLAEFLRQEINEKPHYFRNKDWEMLVGKPKEYLRPKESIEEQRQKFPETTKKLREALSRGYFEKLGVSSETIAVLSKNIPDIAFKVLDMHTRFYESIVAYAKQISDERDIKPIDVVGSFEGRDEIYRRTFQTKDQFEGYNNTSLQMMIMGFGAIYKTMEELEPAQKIPVLGRFLKRTVDKASKNIPPKTIAESFLRDEIAYNARRANRIYRR
jgi:hypothetical protein